MRLPTFIGIGAPKAGTTWLFRCLQEHPAVFAAAVKETNFFDYATITGRMHEYAAHFSTAAGCQAVGEISTRYLTSCRAPFRIRTYLPTARLFVTVRNP
ncbi:MAG: sulfotransferase, partial [Candidatus Tectomicrobia bacterium]|nr:sulfotransferase [Candidatus Tectomicrobia bacterium]